MLVRRKSTRVVSFLFWGMAAAFSVYIPALIASGLGYCFDLLDEGYSINLIQYPDSYHEYVTVFYRIIHFFFPGFQTVFELRVLNLSLFIFSALFLAWSLSGWFKRFRLSSLMHYSLVFFVFGGTFLIYIHFPKTPNYNSLNAIFMTWSVALILQLEQIRPVSNRFLRSLVVMSFVLGFLSVFIFFVKPPSGLSMALLFAFYFIVNRKFPLVQIFLSYFTGIAVGVLFIFGLVMDYSSWSTAISSTGGVKTSSYAAMLLFNYMKDMTEFLIFVAMFSFLPLNAVVHALFLRRAGRNRLKMNKINKIFFAIFGILVVVIFIPPWSIQKKIVSVYYFTFILTLLPYSIFLKPKTENRVSVFILLLIFFALPWAYSAGTNNKLYFGVMGALVVWFPVISVLAIYAARAVRSFFFLYGVMAVVMLYTTLIFSFQYIYKPRGGYGSRKMSYGFCRSKIDIPEFHHIQVPMDFAGVTRKFSSALHQKTFFKPGDPMIMISHRPGLPLLLEAKSVGPWLFEQEDRAQRNCANIAKAEINPEKVTLLIRKLDMDMNLPIYKCMRDKGIRYPEDFELIETYQKRQRRFFDEEYFLFAHKKNLK